MSVSKVARSRASSMNTDSMRNSSRLLSTQQNQEIGTFYFLNSIIIFQSAMNHKKHFSNVCHNIQITFLSIVHIVAPFLEGSTLGTCRRARDECTCTLVEVSRVLSSIQTTRDVRFYFRLVQKCMYFFG
jgi:hypothetical protein